MTLMSTENRSKPNEPADDAQESKNDWKHLVAVLQFSCQDETTKALSNTGGDRAAAEVWEQC